MDHSGMDMGGMGGMDMGGEGSATSMSGGHMMMKMYMHGTLGGDVLWFRSWQPSSAGATVGVCIGLFLLAILDRYLHALWRACTAAWARGNVGFALPVASGVEYITRAEDEDDGGSVRAVPVPAKVESSCCAEKEKNTEKSLSPTLPSDSFAPAPCQCGCGGECGASSAPQYRELPTPQTEKQLDKMGASTPPPFAALALPPAARRNLDPNRTGRWSRPFRWSADVPRGLLWAVQTIIHYLLMLTVMTFQLWWIISIVVGAGVGEALFGRFGAR